MGSGNNTTIVLSLLVFYGSIIALLFLVSLSQPDAPSYTAPEGGITGVFDLIEAFLSFVGYFFTMTVFMATIVPFWAMAMLFLPLLGAVVYIIFSYIRGTA